VNEDVWMSIFVHSLEGDAMKWFRALPLGSIDDIEALDNSYLRQWGEKKEFMYYMIEFGSLKRKEGESISNFSKRFNKIYNKIHAKINPSEYSTKITCANAFDTDFCLLLRERRDTSLAHMQDSTMEVESNILVVDKLKNNIDRDIPRRIFEASTSNSSTLPPQMDEVTKVLKSLLANMERWELEGKTIYRNSQNTDRIGFKRLNNNVPQIMPREQRNKDRDDQRIQTPLQNNLVVNEEGEEIEELGPQIHCIEDTSPFPHLTQILYEESIMNSKINELSKGGEAKDSMPNRYNLRSKKNEGKSDILDQPLIVERHAKPATLTTREKKTQNISSTSKDHVLEVREISKPPSSFSFEHEIQKIRIPVPLSELVKNEDFKRSLSKLLQSEPPHITIDSVNLQDENPTFILGPMVEDKDDSSPPLLYIPEHTR
jgi:hypothetical protein